MGPLEYILNTPSHHRVHHGRNPYCIDKNYAGFLIIWDRIFGILFMKIVISLFLPPFLCLKQQSKNACIFLLTKEYHKPSFLHDNFILSFELNWFLAKYTKDMKELVFKEKIICSKRFLWVLQGENAAYSYMVHGESE